MQITPDELLAEAGRMALEIRLKDQAIAAMQKRIEELSGERRSSGDGGRGEGEAHVHVHGSRPETPVAGEGPAEEFVGREAEATAR